MHLGKGINEGWPTYRFSLCFRNASSEAAFLASRTNTLLSMACVTRILLLTFASIMFLRDFIERRAMIFKLVRGVEAGVHLACFCFERSHIFRSRLSPAFRDRWFGLHLALFPISRLANDGYYLSKIVTIIFGPQPDVEIVFNGVQNYGGLVLSFSCMLARIMPMRFISQVPGDIMAIICFCIAAALLPPGALLPPIYIVVHVMVFGLLVAVLSYTGRSNERVQRELFVKVAVEKALRAIAEHNASLGEGSTDMIEHRLQGPSSCLSTSMLSSSPTAAVFGKFTGGNITAKLAGIGRLGQEENWLVDIGELAPSSLRMLGSGGFGYVVPALYHGADVALKVCCHGGRDVSEVLATAAHELRLLRRLHHPNLVTFYGACVQNETAELLLVLEHVHGPRLVEVAARPFKEVTFLTRLTLACDVASALSYLHSRSPPVVHGDLKGGNALAERLPTGGVRAKLLDFGLSRVLRRGSPEMGGTRAWAAPEVLRGGANPHTSADMYSFGWVVFNLISRRHPSEMPDSVRAAPARAMQQLDAGAGRAPHFTAVMQLVTACTRHDPEDRPPISSLLPSMSELLRRNKQAPADGCEAGMTMAQCLEVVGRLVAQRQANALDGDGARAPSPRRESL